MSQNCSYRNNDSTSILTSSFLSNSSGGNRFLKATQTSFDELTGDIKKYPKLSLALEEVFESFLQDTFKKVKKLLTVSETLEPVRGHVIDYTPYALTSTRGYVIAYLRCQDCIDLSDKFYSINNQITDNLQTIRCYNKYISEQMYYPDLPSMYKASKKSVGYTPLPILIKPHYHLKYFLGDLVNTLIQPMPIDIYYLHLVLHKIQSTANSRKFEKNYWMKFYQLINKGEYLEDAHITCYKMIQKNMNIWVNYWGRIPAIHPVLFNSYFQTLMIFYPFKIRYCIKASYCYKKLEIVKILYAFMDNWDIVDQISQKMTKITVYQ